MQLDAEFARDIEAAVGEIESATSAELVVVACRRAGDYRDLPLIAGLLVSFACLSVLIFVPTVISALDTLVTLGVVFVATYLLVRRAPELLAPLVTRRRRLAELRARAEREFTRCQVSATAERNGVLVLVGVLENLVAVLPDLGVENHLKRGDLQLLFEDLQPRRDGREALVLRLRQLGERLAQAWPKTETDRDDLPNDVRIYP